MPLSKISINRTILATVLIVVTCLLGVTGCKTTDAIHKSLTEPQMVEIKTSCPDTDKSIIEEQVIIPLEISIKDIPGIIMIESHSYKGLSQIIVNIDRSVDIQQTINSIHEKILEAQKTLTIDCEPPIINVSDGLFKWKRVK